MVGSGDLSEGLISVIGSGDLSGMLQVSCICHCYVDFDLNCIYVFLTGFTSVIVLGDLSGGFTSVR